ncbi:MAG: hypothetical protein KBF33_11585, partial [Comamonas sp.]|nr:hypothetical protein [Comamonas sp.]
MALPLIPIAFGVSALASAVTGLKKGWDAKKNYSTAQEWIKTSEQQLRDTASALDARREEVCVQLNGLGTQRLQIVSKSIAKFAQLMNQIAGSDFGEIRIDGYDMPVEVIPKSELENA